MPRAAAATRLETVLDELLRGQQQLLEEMRQGRQAITERLDRIEANLAQKNRRGGRAPTVDWFLFAVEAARLEYQDESGIQDRKHLTVHLTDWLAKNSPNPPGDRAIREKIAIIAEKLGLA